MVILLSLNGQRPPDLWVQIYRWPRLCGGLCGINSWLDTEVMFRVVHSFVRPELIQSVYKLIRLVPGPRPLVARTSCFYHLLRG
jgi:hypothetical protein